MASRFGARLCGHLTALTIESSSAGRAPLETCSALGAFGARAISSSAWLLATKIQGRGTQGVGPPSSRGPRAPARIETPVATDRDDETSSVPEVRVADPSQSARVHPGRLFYPGQTYRPEDLDTGRSVDPLAFASNAGSASSKYPQLAKVEDLTLEEISEQVDFRNARRAQHRARKSQFLSNFVSDAGKLIPRRITRLPAKLQHRVAAGVKTARAMAIMPYTEKLALFARKSRNPYK